MIQEGTNTERLAVEALVQGCAAQQNTEWLPTYLAERLFGNCRSLSQAPLAKANLNLTDLSFANLGAANLRAANLIAAILSSADLSDANLSSAHLSSAHLSSAHLSFADLSDADLSDANFSDSILLATDLRNTKNLQISQLTGENPPLLCNVALPSTLTNVDPKRDCDQIAQVLEKRYQLSPAQAAYLVDKAKRNQWN